MRKIIFPTPEKAKQEFISKQFTEIFTVGVFLDYPVHPERVVPFGCYFITTLPVRNFMVRDGLQICPSYLTYLFDRKRIQAALLFSILSIFS